MNQNNENDTTHKSEINATMAFTQSLANILKRLGKGFYIGVKVSLNNEYGVVIERNGVSDWNIEPSI